MAASQDRFSIDAVGDKLAAKHLEEMGKRARKAKAAGFKIRTIYRKSEEARFASQGHGTWAGLTDATKARKRRDNLDPRVNRATNALYRSLTSPRAKDQIDDRRDDHFRFGTTVPYAPYVDAKRKLIDLTRPERREIDEAIADYVATGAGGNASGFNF